MPRHFHADGAACPASPEKRELFIIIHMAHDLYYWHYRCSVNRELLTRIDFVQISDGSAAQVFAGKLPVPKFLCRFCGQEHNGYLERSPFGNR
jgi:hypothetical protein